MTEFPKTIEAWKGFTMESVSELTVERGLIDHWLEAVRDGDPVYWNDEVAKEVADGIVAPGPMAPAFVRSYRWTPRRPLEVWDMHGVEPPGTPSPPRWPTEIHYRLKEFTGLKEGIMAGTESVFYEPIRLGDRVHCISRVLDIGEIKTNKLGTGRPWTVEVEYKNQRGQTVAIDTYKYFTYNRKA